MEHPFKYFTALKVNLMVAMAIMERGTLELKLTVCLLMTLAVSPAAWFIDIVKRHILADSDFIGVLFILLAIDLVTGMVKHLKLRTFDWKRLYTGLLEKVFISMIGMVLFNVIGSIQQWDKAETLKDYIILVGKLVNVFYVGGSAFNNMFVITGGKFPPVGWMNRMKKFNEDMNIDELTKGFKGKKTPPADADSPYANAEQEEP